jgi:hypothetical protein
MAETYAFPSLYKTIWEKNQRVYFQKTRIFRKNISEEQKKREGLDIFKENLWFSKKYVAK